MKAAVENEVNTDSNLVSTTQNDNGRSGIMESVVGKGQPPWERE